MNFLAHLFLSFDDEHLLVGNFIADDIANQEVKTLPESIQKGVVLHRKIDSFTDKHPKVLESARFLYPLHSKYAPVLLDVFYDFLLANNWEKYAEEPFEVFVQKTYLTLQEKSSWFPKMLRERLPYMIADNWLAKYATREGLEFVFDKMLRRVSKPALFENATDTLLAYRPFFEENFNQFFPEIIEFVKTEIKD